MLIYFRRYGSRKTLLDQCLKSRALRDPSQSKIINAPKYCWNMYGSTFTKFIDHCEGNWHAKSFCYWHGRSQDCFLTHWVPMASILFLIEAIYRNEFRCNYLENKKHFLRFFFGFLKPSLNFQDFLKKDDPHCWCISEFVDTEKPGEINT